MARQQKLKRVTDISKPVNVAFNIVLIFLAIAAVFPLLFVLSISLSSKESILKFGYQLIPSEVTLESYKTILKSGSQIVQAFRNSIIITVVGTLLGLFTTISYAYAVSRHDFKYRKFFNFIAFLPMLFSGGLAASFVVNTRILGFQDKMYALILPPLLSAYNIVVMRTFFQTSVPFALIEAAQIDGASEMQIFFQIVLPISLPGVATIALFLSLGYWNDWMNAMLYLKQNSPLQPLQYLLMQIQKNIEVIIQKKGQMGSIADEALATLPEDGIRMAIVVVATLPIALSYPFFQRYFVEGLTLGAVKA